VRVWVWIMFECDCACVCIGRTVASVWRSCIGQQWLEISQQMLAFGQRWCYRQSRALSRIQYTTREGGLEGMCVCVCDCVQACVT
jgi:sulfite reductase beta subunit-like hemoprotein